MYKNIKYIGMLCLAAVMVQGCDEYKFDDPEPLLNSDVDPQALDFSGYISLGGSYTAGFMDNALYSEGQHSAYPVLLAETFRAANPSLVFNVPDVNDEVGYSRTVVVNQTETYHLGRFKFDEPGNVPAIKGNAYAYIYDPAFDPGRQGCPHVVRALFDDSPTRPQDYFTPYSGPKFQNYALPNVSLVQMFNPGLGDPLDANVNDYFLRVKNDTFNTVLDDALNQDYTFFTMWFGITELSTFALDGGQGFLTSSADFGVRIRAVIGDVLRSKSSHGLIAYVPNILDFPFFNGTTESSGVNTPFALTAQQAAELNRAYWLQGYPRVDYFHAGNDNHYLIETRTGALRQFRPGKEYVTIDFAFIQGQLGSGQARGCDGEVVDGIGLGIAHLNEVIEVDDGVSVPLAFPIPGQYVLDQDEVTSLTQRAAEYNDEISEALIEVLSDPDNLESKAINRIGIVEMDKAFLDFKRDGAIYDESGFPIMYYDDGIAGVFSADGLHVTPKGQAWVANEFIKKLNGRFGTNFSTIDLIPIRGNDYAFTP